MSDEADDGSEYPTLEVADREFGILQVATILAGWGLAVSYILPWVDIDGHVWPTTEGQAISPEEFEEGVDASSVTAWEITVLPEIIAVLGVVTIVIAILRWQRWTHLTITAVGFIGTGITLFMREGLLQDPETQIRVGEYQGLASAFSPGLGLWVALVCSALLIGVGFAAFLNTFDEE